MLSRTERTAREPTGRLTEEELKGFPKPGRYLNTITEEPYTEINIWLIKGELTGIIRLNPEGKLRKGLKGSLSEEMLQILGNDQDLILYHRKNKIELFKSSRLCKLNPHRPDIYGMSLDEYIQEFLDHNDVFSLPAEELAKRVSIEGAEGAMCRARLKTYE